jgi:hypothetical protein
MFVRVGAYECAIILFLVLIVLAIVFISARSRHG